MKVTRRQFFKVCAGGLGTSSIVALGFSPVNVLAEVYPAFFTFHYPGWPRESARFTNASLAVFSPALADGKRGRVKIKLSQERDEHHHESNSH